MCWGRRGGVAVHGQGLLARQIGALLAFAAAGASQEGHCSFHEVAPAVFRQGVSWGSGVGGREGHAAAVLVCGVGAEARGALLAAVMSGRVDRLGPGHVMRR